MQMTKTERALGHLYCQIQDGLSYAEAFRATIAKFGFFGANAQRLQFAYEAHETMIANRRKELAVDPFHPQAGI